MNIRLVHVVNQSSKVAGFILPVTLILIQIMVVSSLVILQDLILVEKLNKNNKLKKEILR